MVLHAGEDLGVAICCFFWPSRARDPGAPRTERKSTAWPKGQIATPGSRPPGESGTTTPESNGIPIWWGPNRSLLRLSGRPPLGHPKGEGVVGTAVAEGRGLNRNLRTSEGHRFLLFGWTRRTHGTQEKPLPGCPGPGCGDLPDFRAQRWISVRLCLGAMSKATVAGRVRTGDGHPFQDTRAF